MTQEIQIDSDDCAGLVAPAGDPDLTAVEGPQVMAPSRYQG